MTSEHPVVRYELPSTTSRLFADTRWDAIPVIAGVLHYAYFLALYFLFPHLPLWVMLILGFIYAVSISWNVNGISHNFIHNPYFRSPLLNRLFSLMLSVTCCFWQIYHDVVHAQHHKGNSDRKDENGDTIDWISTTALAARSSRGRRTWTAMRGGGFCRSAGRTDATTKPLRKRSRNSSTAMPC